MVKQHAKNSEIMSQDASSLYNSMVTRLPEHNYTLLCLPAVSICEENRCFIVGGDSPELCTLFDRLSPVVLPTTFSHGNVMSASLANVHT